MIRTQYRVVTKPGKMPLDSPFSINDWSASLTFTALVSILSGVARLDAAADEAAETTACAGGGGGG